jgi:RNA polymerase sigma factor (sigma-70 family)
MRQWTWWPSFFQLLRIEDDALTLALSERKFPSRRIWKTFELVNRRHRKLHLLKEINALAKRAQARLADAAWPKMDEASCDLLRAFARLDSFETIDLSRYKRIWSQIPDDNELSVETYKLREKTRPLAEWLIEIRHPERAQFERLHPVAARAVFGRESARDELTRAAKLERSLQSGIVIKRTREDAEDVRLMELVIRGGTNAFTELRKRHQWGVYRFVWGRMKGKGKTVVDDITQRVFIQVWKEAPRYAPTAKFTTWLLQIAKNLAINERKRAASEKERSEFDHFSRTGSRGIKSVRAGSSDGILLIPGTDFNTSPGTVEADSNSDRLREVLIKLPKKQQRIVKAHFGLGCEPQTDQALAGELVITASEVEKLRQETLDQLRQLMEPNQ